MASEGNSDSGSNPDKDLPVVPAHKRLLYRIQHTCTYLVRYWWAWEVLAASISISSTIVLIVVLAWANGRPQSSLIFGRIGLTINTIIALTSTVIRASLLIAVAGPLTQSWWNWFAHKNGTTSNTGQNLRDIDTFGDAAANSWYSLVLLWRTRGRTLAALGAAVTISSLAFDAFSQQVLTTTVIRTDRDQNGGSDLGNLTLPRATKFPISGLKTANLPMLPSEEVRAVLSSFPAAKIEPPNVECPTGNCRWPPTSTLGLCSSCADLTDQIQIAPLSSEEEEYLTFYILQNITKLSFASLALQNQTSIHFTSPNGFDPMSENWEIQNLSIIIPSGESFGSLPNVPADGIIGNISVMDIQNPPVGDHSAFVSSYTVLGVSPKDYQDFIKVWRFQPLHSEKIQALLTAYKCTFKFCLQNIAAEMSSGVMRQTLVSTWDHFQLDRTDLKFEVDAGFAPIDVPDDMDIPNSSDYKVPLEWMSIMKLALEGIFQGAMSIITDALIKKPLSNNTSCDSMECIMNTTTSFFLGDTSSDQHAQIIWEASSSIETMSAHASKVAAGVTNYIRTTYGQSNSTNVAYFPTVFHEVTIVQVNWPWLTFPLGLLIAGHVFLLATIWQTKRRNIRPWKGHRLPLLMAKLDPSIQEIAAGGMDTRTGLENRVGHIRVVLDYDKDDKIYIRRVGGQ